ncbi:unnamed protein product [Prorocentrum cordatum]|uniref:Uncharacterized protein n=1 Tax=Prorocentrum cordatum TaxID=2364126 RepID=A0ABN9V6T7_9DINO|nr:unnamed protein product [Polarella glacialis]
MFNMLARNQLPTHDSFRQSACRSASHGLIHVSLVSIRSGCPCKGGVRGQGGREEEEEEEVSRGGHTWPPRAPRRAPRGPARCPPARGRPAGCSVRARGAPRPELAALERDRVWEQLWSGVVATVSVSPPRRPPTGCLALPSFLA